MPSHLRSTKRAFSVIEMIVTMTIILILTTIVLVGYRKGGQQLALNRAAHKLTQDIRRAQELAMSSTPFEDGASSLVPFGYGIFFTISEEKSYSLFADVNGNKYFDTGEQVGEPIAFEEGIEISDLQKAAGEGGGNLTEVAIVFHPPDPEIFFFWKPGMSIVNIPGNKVSVIIKSADDSLGTRRISVNKAGLVDLE